MLNVVKILKTTFQCMEYIPNIFSKHKIKKIFEIKLRGTWGNQYEIVILTKKHRFKNFNLSYRFFYNVLM